MTSPPGRRGVESICLEALARPLEERPAFLEGACAGDAGLRQDVEALLARAAGFMEAPARSCDLEGALPEPGTQAATMAATSTALVPALIPRSSRLPPCRRAIAWFERSL